MLLRQNSPLLLAKLIIPDYGISISHHQGEVAEWSMASVLKTEVAQATVGSNPTLSAIHCIRTDFASLCVFIGYSGILVFLGVAWLTVLNGRKVGNPLEIGQKTVADS
jgi:hypothetical protein